jgi:hypothetical protein
MITQLALFPEPQEMAIQHTGMRQRLVDCLERLVQTMEAESSLPEAIYSVSLGARCFTPRVEKLCAGYTHRALASEQRLAQMLLGVCIGLMLFDFAKVLYQLDRLPDAKLIREAVDLISEYKASGGVIDEPYNKPMNFGAPKPPSARDRKKLEEERIKREEEHQWRRAMEIAMWTVWKEEVAV